MSMKVVLAWFSRLTTLNVPHIPRPYFIAPIKHATKIPNWILFVKKKICIEKLWRVGSVGRNAILCHVCMRLSWSHMQKCSAKNFWRSLPHFALFNLHSMNLMWICSQIKTSNYIIAGNGWEGFRMVIFNLCIVFFVFSKSTVYTNIRRGLWLILYQN